MSAIDELQAKVINMSFTELMDDYIEHHINNCRYIYEYILLVQDELNRRMDKDRG
jgi:hypothetical protein